jgi:DNA-binding CsgD family transcriptional regulator
MRHRNHARPRTQRLDPALVEAIRYIPVPTFVVSATGEIVAMNGAGHAWLESAPERESLLSRAGGPAAETFRVTPSRAGHRSYSLAVLRRAELPAAESRTPMRWGLTPREEEVAGCIARGVTNQQIAAQLGCSSSTIERHVTNILRKANVANRATLIVAIMSG